MRKNYADSWGLHKNTNCVFPLRKDVLKICSKFKGEHPCQSVMSMKLLCKFIEIALRHRCSPVNLLHIFKTPFSKNTSGRLRLSLTGSNVKIPIYEKFMMHDVAFIRIQQCRSSENMLTHALLQVLFFRHSFIQRVFTREVSSRDEINSVYGCQLLFTRFCRSKKEKKTCKHYIPDIFRYILVLLNFFLFLFMSNKYYLPKFNAITLSL